MLIQQFALCTNNNFFTKTTQNFIPKQQTIIPRTRAFGARARRSPSYQAANQGAKKKQTAMRARIDLYACNTLKNAQAGSTQK